MDLDQQLSAAFAEWSEARDALGRLRARLGLRPGAQAQLAASPEVAELFAEIGRQEALCDAKFAALCAIADRRSEHREQAARGEALRQMRFVSGDPQD